MNEAEWLACTDPLGMLAFLKGKASDRKLRLFAVACCRRIWPVLTSERSRKAIEDAEQYADGTVDRNQLQSAFLTVAGSLNLPGGLACAVCNEAPHAAWVVQAIGELCAHLPGQAKMVQLLGQADLLRDLFGRVPFHPMTLPQTVRAWNEDRLQRLAEAAYENRLLPSGHLDSLRLNVLADALEEAAADAEMIEHLRKPGPHCRGCWAVDAILGRE